MTDPVIAGVEDAPGVGEAVDWAADEAQARAVPLHLVHAWLRQPYDTPEWRGNADGERAGHRLLDGMAERVRARHPTLEVSGELVDAGPLDALTSLSRTARLLVLGARGSGGFPRLLVGSTSLRLAAGAHCPVVVVPAVGERSGDGDGGSRADGGVAVGLGGRGPRDELLHFAFETAQRWRLPLRAVHAWRYPLVQGPGRSGPPVFEEGDVAAERAVRLSEALAGWRQRYPDVLVREDVVRSGAARHLVALSATDRLVVVGRRGTPEGPRGRLGSVSQAVVNYARCPVAVVPEG
jgi:nucleotide-binding universal stress UspA family protein